MQQRQLYQWLWCEHITQKPMVFISGPRQAGKTTFAEEIIGERYTNKLYFNWDIIENKKTLLENPTFFEEKIRRIDKSTPLIIFDEIHKYKLWKQYLKGIYDQFHKTYDFIASGSGRLDLSKKGGESLAGRYLEMHLFPFTIAELARNPRKIDAFLENPLSPASLHFTQKTKDIWLTLTELGGFPEPYIKGHKTFWRKWSQTIGRQVIREDMKDFSDIKLLDDVEILFSLLPSRVGSPISMNNLATDLQVNFETIKKWITLFDHFYLTFRLSPWTQKIARSLLKEKKVYLYNYPLIVDPASRFENMVALELLRAVTFWNEAGWGNFGLYYLRDKEKREVDFAVTHERKPILLLECKLSEDTPSENLKYFQTLLKVPAIQLVCKEGVFKHITAFPKEFLIITAHTWLASLP